MRRIAAVVAVAAAVLFSLAAPASAHSSVLSGSSVCSNTSHVITWSIGNDFGLTMGIDSVSAVMAGQSYDVTGYTTPVAVAPGTTSATTTVPGALTGTITLTVHGTWSDNFQQTNSTAVVLETSCLEGSTTTTSTSTTSTSTTTTAPTTTTVPDTTTTLPATTTVPSTTAAPTTSTTEAGSTTTVPVVPPTTVYRCTAANTQWNEKTQRCELADTGSNSAMPVGLGIVTLLGGAGLALVRRRRTI